jgi:DNA-binding protein Fis
MQQLQRTIADDVAAEMNEAKSEVIKTLAYTLLREVYGVDEPRNLDVTKGINFYDEVRRFEIGLITQALVYTKGKQSAAASLLNLNATTLHAKIKFYGIEVPAIRAAGYLPSERK